MSTAMGSSSGSTTGGGQGTSVYNASQILSAARVIPPNDDEKKPLWRYVEMLEKTGKGLGGNSRFRCRLCDNVISGSNIGQHLH